MFIVRQMAAHSFHTMDLYTKSDRKFTHSLQFCVEPTPDI